MRQPAESIFIGGKWISVPKTFPVRDPATLEEFARCADAGPSDAIEAADAAVRAFASWAAATSDERGRYLIELAERIERSASGLETLLVRESGKPRAEAVREVASSVAYLRWNAGEAGRVAGRIVPSPWAGHRMWTLRQPVGVVAAITPWNYPLNTLCRKVAPALAAGCTVLVKPAPETPLSAVRLAELSAEAGFPAGVFNVVTTTRAPEVVGAWMDDPRVRKIAFTGSTEVGRVLYADAARTMKRLSLELGGNAAVLVFADADLDAAADAIVASRYRHAGQTCVCAQRVCAERGIAEELCGRIAQRVARLRVGNGLDPGTEVGPLISAEALARVEDHIADAVAQGAGLLAGGKPVVLPDPDRGCFYAPTVLAGVRPAMRISREETFGPVLAVAEFDSEEEAISMANATPYGLVAYAFTRNLNRTWRLIEGIEAGSVAINTTAVVAPALAIGGMKMSGLGRENGQEGLEEYLETKSAVIRIE
jgi:succinate-semialdehyde dehydrogenase / glutarate-semialdehyde dehydrogenase